MRLNIFLIVFTCLSISLKGQKKESHIFLKPDKIPNCSIVKFGKFLSVNYASTEYYLEANNEIVTEYVADGKYFVKTKRIFLSECIYESTIIEVTIPNYNKKVGETLTTEILETECEFVKVRIKMGNNELITVLEKTK